MLPRGRDGETPFLLGDVCGKGIEAAVLSGRVRQSLHALRLVEREPTALLDLLNTAFGFAGTPGAGGPRRRGRRGAVPSGSATTTSRSRRASGSWNAATGAVAPPSS